MIIAEAGTNYAAEGPFSKLESATDLANVAADCGADYVKFQMFTEGELFCPLKGDEARWPRWRQCFMDFADWKHLKAHCEEIGIGFMASAFQTETVQWLVDLECDYIKVASRAVKDFPYEIFPKTPLIMSDGMYPLPHHINGIKLQCTSEYPTPLEQARWNRHDGLSDHSGTPWPAIDALSRGAKAVEMHFYTEEWHHDKESSLTVDELKLVCDARDGFAAMRESAGGRFENHKGTEVAGMANSGNACHLRERANGGLLRK
jgi:sialic acid synthase SpsE